MQTVTRIQKPDGFNLGVPLRELYDGTKITDPAAAADWIFKRIPVEERGDVLLMLMREHCQVYFSQRRGVRPRTDEENAPLYDGERDGEETDRLNAVSQSSVNRRFGGQAFLLRMRVNVDGTNKLFRDCTAVDMDCLASVQVENAERAEAKAAFYKRVKKAMDKHGASVFGDLPREIIEALDVDRGGAR